MTAAPPLDDLVVVDLSSGIAGAYCTKILTDGGAEVVKVEPPEGDTLRRWSASGAVIAEGGEGPLFTFLASGKQRLVANPDDGEDVKRVRALFGRADVVVWSRGSRLAECPAFSPDAIRRLGPHLTVTSITPFGLEGPWCDRAATEFTLQAWSGGIVGLGRGAPDRAPMFIGGQIGEWLTGTYEATVGEVGPADSDLAAVVGLPSVEDRGEAPEAEGPAPEGDETGTG